MPGGDKSGPLGLGPMTGRAAGFCTGNNMPGYMNRMGMGAGTGRRRGRRHFSQRNNFFGYDYYNRNNVSELSPQEEIRILQNQSETLSKQLEDINKRLNEIKDHEQ